MPSSARPPPGSWMPGAPPPSPSSPPDGAPAPRRPGRLTAVIVMLVLLLVAGVLISRHGNESRRSAFTSVAASTGGNVKHACSLVTKAEAEALMGESIPPPIEKPVGPYGTACTYGTDGDQSPGAHVDGAVLVQVLTADYYAKNFKQNKDADFQTAASTNGGKVDVTVNGVGDDAYCSEALGLIGFAALKGSTEIDVDFGAKDGGCAIAQAFAEKAIGRL